jgi:hypothetical protein
MIETSRGVYQWVNNGDLPRLLDCRSASATDTLWLTPMTAPISRTSPAPSPLPCSHPSAIVFIFELRGLPIICLSIHQFVILSIRVLNAQVSHQYVSAVI